jgi:hypothetical protein
MRLISLHCNSIGRSGDNSATNRLQSRHQCADVKVSAGSQPICFCVAEPAAAYQQREKSFYQPRKFFFFFGRFLVAIVFSPGMMPSCLARALLAGNRIHSRQRSNGPRRRFSIRSL